MGRYLPDYNVGKENPKAVTQIILLADDKDFHAFVEIDDEHNFPGAEIVLHSMKASEMESGMIKIEGKLVVYNKLLCYYRSLTFSSCV